MELSADDALKKEIAVAKRNKSQSDGPTWFSPLLDVAINAFGCAVVILILLMLLIGRHVSVEPLRFLVPSAPVALIAGQNFAYTLGVSGGSGTRVFEAEGIPGWLHLDTQSGTLAGVAPEPHGAGASVSFTVRAHDGSGKDEARLQLQISPSAFPLDPVKNPLRLLTDGALAHARVGSSYRAPLAVRGVIEPLGCRIVASKPPANIRCDGGVVEWSPTTPGRYEITVRIEPPTNAYTYHGVTYRWPSTSVDRQFAVEVLPRSPTEIVGGEGRVGERLAIALADGRLAVGEHVTWKNDIPGMVETADGSALVGTPTAPGRFPVAYEIADDAGTVVVTNASTVMIASARGPLALGDVTLQAWAGEEVAIDFPYSSAVEPVTITSVGNLPSGLQIVNNRLTGRTDAIGMHTMRLALVDQSGRRVEHDFVIRVGPRF